MYRENINELMEKSGMTFQTLIIPKNTGLFKYTGQLLKDAGLDLDDAVKVGTSRLELNGLEILLRRGDDVPRLISDFAANGKCAMGLTGDDLYDEFRLGANDSNLSVLNTYDWYDPNARFYRPALCFINRTGKKEDIPEQPIIAISQKYINTSKPYIEKITSSEKKKFRQASYTGDIEMTVADGITDCCIDVVYTGNTLKENNLEVIEPIRFSDLVVLIPKIVRGYNDLQR